MLLFDPADLSTLVTYVSTDNYSGSAPSDHDPKLAGTTESLYPTDQPYYLMDTPVMGGLWYASSATAEFGMTATKLEVKATDSWGVETQSETGMGDC